MTQRMAVMLTVGVTVCALMMPSAVSAAESINPDAPESWFEWIMPDDAGNCNECTELFCMEGEHTITNGSLMNTEDPEHLCDSEPFEDDECSDHTGCGESTQDFEAALLADDVRGLARLILEDPGIFVNSERGVVQATSCSGQVGAQTTLTAELLVTVEELQEDEEVVQY